MKISFGLRAVLIYFLILGTLSWVFLERAVEHLNVGLRQSAESVLVDTANLLATSLEHSLVEGQLDTASVTQLFEDAYLRKLDAQIFQVLKARVDLEAYVTDKDGIVVYHSSKPDVGEDYSQWRDVLLTIEGKYGARSSFRDPDVTDDEFKKNLIVAAPIYWRGDIIGVVSVAKPIQTFQNFLLDESSKLKQFAWGLLALALLLGFFVSYGFTIVTRKLADYARDMAAGKKVNQPRFMDHRFSNLSNAIADMRKQLDGKEYVENYIHSLTHELKTPITAIEAAAELLDEDMPKAEQQKFIGNIRRSNYRMGQLVERLLSLARLEGMPAVEGREYFDLTKVINSLLGERQALIAEQEISVESAPSPLVVQGDRLLIQQAVANLLDNALAFSPAKGTIKIETSATKGQTPVHYRVSVFNTGRPLDAFVMERAFDRFFSMPRPGDEAKSTGLGLSFVREIMKLHQGSAVIENAQDGNGVVATLWWSNNGKG